MDTEKDLPLNYEATFDVAVVGAGPAGLAAGFACAEAGLRTTVVGPHADARDGRTAALLDGSINLLKRLGVWERVASASTPLRAIRLVDATGALVRAPEVVFEASEIGLPAFGYNIPNATLTSAFEAVSHPRLTRLVDPKATVSDLAGTHAVLSTSTGLAIKARLLVAADGRESPTRTSAGIRTSSWSYPQTAIVTTFAHSRPHRGVSTELHRPQGPLTVVPGPGNTSNLVWVEAPGEAERLVALDDESFNRELTAHVGALLGVLSDLMPRRAFPLSGRTASVLGQSRVVLVGEAAHVIPPIGAQGLNLGFRDAATIAEVADEAMRAGEDIGGEQVLSNYDHLRRGDVAFRIFAVDLLNRSLLSSVPGIHLARGFGLFALATSRRLRARVMREGIMPSIGDLSFMRPLHRSGEIPAARP
ncbi:2-octaprenyl-6-methoxyphenyl hydroxylase [Hyphomicrobium denitrificans 1NES1]|uniref:2-octaprenyl-6-methoxyphenyl hydroxylase n=1 Tax=Hyphomicrobium denitrificans 1NES1 TaxID=670307 RepID=N0B2H6_9HYPH|nr:2-octaprenyl-6-methoxyphenyl hydroxylase [Hyphomicrobium denitrificans 1NES1]